MQANTYAAIKMDELDKRRAWGYFQEEDQRQKAPYSNDLNDFSIKVFYWDSNEQRMAELKPLKLELATMMQIWRTFITGGELI